ncbi:MAG: penicillin-binding protein 1A [Hyphomicrobiales bacterium]
MFRLIGIAVAAGFALLLGVAGFLAYTVIDIADDLPDYAKLAEYEPPVMTRVHAGDGSLIAEYADEKRLFVPVNAIPKRLVAAFVSAEDKTFFEHGGFSLPGIARAAMTDIRIILSGRHKPLVGASTITQQVARNLLLLSNEQTAMRKLKEALLTWRIEHAFSKEEILELYLNEIWLGLRSYGVAAASLNYFGKSLDELDLAQMAYLAALPKGPHNYNPFTREKRAIQRRNWVIGQMLENGYVSEAEAAEAVGEPLGVVKHAPSPQVFSAAYFSEEVRRELIDLYGRDKLYEGGLSVRTTLSPKLQALAVRCLRQGLVDFDRKRGFRGPVEHLSPDGDWGRELAAIDAPADLKPWRLAIVLKINKDSVSIGLRPKVRAGDPVNDKRDYGRIPLESMRWARKALKDGKLGPEITAPGDVLAAGDIVYVAPGDALDQWRLMRMPEIQGAMVVMDPHTGRVLALVGGFSYAMSQFDRAIQAKRQPGSAFKPVVYAAALDSGYTPASVVLDAPISVKLKNGEDWIPRNYERDFYGPSTLRRGIELSRNVMTVRLANDMGLGKIVDYAVKLGVYDQAPAFPSIVLGARETTLLRLTTAYAIFDNGGKRIDATLIDRIQDRYGKTIYRHGKRECPGCRAQSWNGQDEPEVIDRREQALSPYTAYQITSMLEGVVRHGTGRIVGRLVSKPLAGKTGTTNDWKDAWFVGYSSDLAVGVYVGYDMPRSMGKKSPGSAVAAPIFADFMKSALENAPAIPFRVPPGTRFIPIDSKTGQRAAYGGANVILEAFKPGSGPAHETVVIGAGGRVAADRGDTGQTAQPPATREPRLGTGTGGLY